MRVVTLAAAAALALVTAGGASAAPQGFVTSQPAGAVALESGVSIQPILTAGDVVGGYQASGVMDGMGFMTARDGRIRLVVNHELADVNQYPDPDIGAGDQFGARVSQLTLNRDGSVRSGRYLVKGTEGYVWFCSGNLSILDANPWYFTGEEDTFSVYGGGVVAIDLRTGERRDVSWFGHFGHEQEIPVKGLKKAVFVLAEDGSAGVSQLYQYAATSWADALAGRGTLGVFVPDGRSRDGDWSSNDIAQGASIRGHFEPLDQATDNADADALEAAAQAKGAMDFIRLEDATTTVGGHTGVVYFADTGTAETESVRGRIYRLALDPRNPTKATLRLIIDGDVTRRSAAGAELPNIVNPDNLATSGSTLMIQEDRNSEHRFSSTPGLEVQTGYSRILAYSLTTGDLRVVARVATPADIAADGGEGAWETSGIVSASRLWGKGWWLFDVQQHDTTVDQPANPDLRPNTTTGEGGQLLRMFVPGT